MELTKWQAWVERNFFLIDGVFQSALNLVTNHENRLQDVEGCVDVQYDINDGLNNRITALRTKINDLESRLEELDAREKEL